MKTRIHYTRPSITEREVAYAADAAAHGWGERCYEYIGRFEEAFARHLGVRHAIATSSCTGALHLGLAALGVGPGDEVILGDINWIASAAPITYLGASPVLVDVLEESWCIDPAAVEEAITPRTKAILAVHLYGNLCDMRRLKEIGAKHGIPVIEESAEAIGSAFAGGKRAGSEGIFGTFSFHGTKTLTTGEGGMFVTDDSALHERVLTLSNHGRAHGQVKQFWPDAIGYKYKMSNLQAAIGLGQVERIEELIEEKRRIFRCYAEALGDFPVQMNPEAPGTRNGYWMPTLVARAGVPFDRDRLLAEFKAENIDGRVFFWPLSDLPPGLRRPHPTPVAHGLFHRAVNLPSYHGIAEDELARVVEVVRRNLRP